jgi:hypothetical protein
MKGGDIVSTAWSTDVLRVTLREKLLPSRLAANVQEKVQALIEGLEKHFALLLQRVRSRLASVDGDVERAFSSFDVATLRELLEEMRWYKSDHLNSHLEGSPEGRYRSLTMSLKTHLEQAAQQADEAVVRGQVEQGNKLRLFIKDVHAANISEHLVGFDAGAIGSQLLAKKNEQASALRERMEQLLKQQVYDAAAKLLVSHLESTEPSDVRLVASFKSQIEMSLEELRRAAFDNPLTSAGPTLEAAEVSTVFRDMQNLLKRAASAAHCLKGQTAVDVTDLLAGIKRAIEDRFHSEMREFERFFFKAFRFRPASKVSLLFIFSLPW